MFVKIWVVAPGRVHLTETARKDIMQDCDVVIVSAGLAGLMAARYLIAAGKSVRVAEAQDRVGGRSYRMGAVRSGERAAREVLAADAATRDATTRPGAAAGSGGYVPQRRASFGGERRA